MIKMKVTKITFILLSLLFCSCLEKHQQSTLNLFEEDERYKYQLVIPLEIQDSTYYFLWDTGCATSFIFKEDLANSLSAIESNIVKEKFIGVDEVIEGVFETKKISCKLGDFHIPILFYIDDIGMTEKSSPNQHLLIKGIIGQNVISKFNWLFDFENSKVLISKQQIEKNDSALTIPFVIENKNDAPSAYLETDTLLSKFTIDTGYRFFGTFSPEDSLLYYMRPSLVIADSNINVFLKENYSSIKLPENEKKVNRFILRDSININNFIFRNISIFHRDSYRSANYITANFIFQFEKMYYDSQNQEISLINYRGDTHPTGNEKELIEYINKRYK